MHLNKFLIIKTTRCTHFSNLSLKWESTCFGQFLCPSSRFFHCTHSNGIYLTGSLTACEQDQDGILNLLSRVSYNWLFYLMNINHFNTDISLYVWHLYCCNTSLVRRPLLSVLLFLREKLVFYLTLYGVCYIMCWKFMLTHRSINCIIIRSWVPSNNTKYL